MSNDHRDHRDSGTMVMARPVELAAKVRGAQGESCLVLLHPAGNDIGKRTPLTLVKYVVGRDNNSDIPINRSSVSRQHARLSIDDEGFWWVQDLASTNGSFVNEERVVSRKLVDGDQVRFGDVIYKFLSGDNIESAYHEEIYRMTILDGLTGVHNKRYFTEFLDRELAAATRHGHPLSLVMFDVDHFKKVNDTKGHLAGDAVLKDLANRIKSRMRREDLFARYGGEEFACVLPSTDLLGAVVFAEQLRTIIAERPTMFDDQEIPFTISLGVSSMKIDKAKKPDPLHLIKLADDNLYTAKRSGRNQVVPALSDLQPA